MLYLDQEDIRILKGITQLHKNNNININNVIKKGGLLEWATVVSNFYDISIEDFLSQKRHRELVYARREFIHLVDKYTSHTASSIGRFMKKDHTVIIYHKKFKPINLDKIELAVIKVT